MSENINIKPFHVMDILARCKQMEAQGKDVIHMEIGEPDFDTPAPITQAGINALEQNLTHYTSAQGLLSLRESIGRYYLQSYQTSVTAQQIFITPGASGALQLVLSYLLQSKKTLMVSDPCYPCNRNLTHLLGGKVLSVPVTSDTQYQLDIDLLKENWRDDVAAVLVASPSNPTGTLCSVDSLKQMADFLASKNAYLIVDEIYQGLTYGIESQTLAAEKDNIFVVNSFSKYFGMTGWRVGWLVSPDSHVSALDAIAQNTYLATSTLAQHAALAAFKPETQEILQQRRSAFENRRNILCQSLIELGVVIPVIPQGAFYVYVDISKYSSDSFEFCKQLLESQALAITPGCDFGEYQASNYVRFAYTTSEARIEQAIQRLAIFVG